MKYYAAQLCDKGTVAVDDTILVKDTTATAGSHILEGFKPLFSAEAITRLEEKGYSISGKTHVGEFGLDLVHDNLVYSRNLHEESHTLSLKDRLHLVLVDLLDHERNSNDHIRFHLGEGLHDDLRAWYATLSSYRSSNMSPYIWAHGSIETTLCVLLRPGSTVRPNSMFENIAR